MTCQVYHKFIQGELLTARSPVYRPVPLPTIARGLCHLSGHLELLDSTVVDGVQRQVLNWNLTKARFVRLQMGRHTRLRPQLGTLVRQLDGLDLLIAVTQMLPGKAALQGDRRQRAARLSPQSQGTFQDPWLYKGAQASQVSSEVVVES